MMQNKKDSIPGVSPNHNKSVTAVPRRSIVQKRDAAMLLHPSVFMAFTWFYADIRILKTRIHNEIIPIETTIKIATRT